MEKTLYIAYGSNLDLNQMAKRCKSATVVGKSVLKDYRLLFKVHATVEPCEKYNVPVLIWELNPSDEYALDLYEGYRPDGHGYYRKEYVKIRIRKSYRKAMIYIMNNRELSLPYKEYYKIIKEAYKTHGFNLDILQTALQESRK